MQTLAQFGIECTQNSDIKKKERFYINTDVTSVIGVIGDIKGNIAYSLSQDTAKKIVSTMMMGMPVEQLDSMARSAIGELANIITGTAASILGSSGTMVDITPPSVIIGQELYMIISSIEVVVIELHTQFGNIEINIGLE
jgi:chemotaxis protein CheX